MLLKMLQGVVLSVIFFVLFANWQIRRINVLGIALVRNCSIALAWGFLLFGKASYNFCEAEYPLKGTHTLRVRDQIYQMVSTTEQRWSG